MSVPVRPATLADLTAAAAHAFPGRTALTDHEVSWTFDALHTEVERSTRAALAYGLRAGDRVALWAPNSRHWITAALGAVAAGAVLVPLNTRYKPAEAAAVLRRSRARFLFTVGEFLGTDYAKALTASGAHLPDLELTVTLPTDEDPEGDPAHRYADYLAAAEHVTGRSRAQRAAALTPDDLSDTLYTSGTTGSPKGVEITHGQTLRVFTAWAETVGLREGDRYLLVNPFFHTFGYKAGVLACLLTGATMLPEAVYDAGRTLRRVARDGITVLMGPPTIFHTLLQHPARAAGDFASLRLAGLGAADIPVELIHRIRDELGIADVFTAYGLSESTGVATICPTTADASTIAHTVGLPLPGTELRIAVPGRDPAREPAAPGEPGEIQVRGYHVMRGYVDDPEATAAAVDPDGWLHTGDIGRLDAHGHLTVTDRLKDMYIVGGFNAYPTEIEHVLAGHEAVQDVAVVGVPDQRLGEVGAAYVVVREGTDRAAFPAELTAWARERLANYKLPRTVTVLDALPRNASGKVRKTELRGTAPRPAP